MTNINRKSVYHRCGARGSFRCNAGSIESGGEEQDAQWLVRRMERPAPRCAAKSLQELWQNVAL
jgi:hypothetical protein